MKNKINQHGELIARFQSWIEKEKAVETEHSQLTDAIRIGVDGFFPLHVADHLGILQFC